MPSTPEVRLTPTDTQPTQIRRGHALLVVSVGNTLEWYDWFVYSTFAVFFSHQFFAAGDPAAALLATFGIFAVGFFARPIGGWVLGGYADRVGRKAALTLTIALMAAPTFVIAMAPTYEQVGVLAPLILLAARLLQGFAAGGETGGSMAYLTEVAPANRRATFSSLWYSTAVAGIVFATVLGWVLTTALSEEDMTSWGWRIPFAIGGIAGLIGLWVRRSMNESQTFVEAATNATPAKRNRLVTLFTQHPKQAFRVMGLMAGASVGFYTIVSYLPTLFINSVGLSADLAFVAHTVALIVFIIVLPVLGRISDHIGRKPIAGIYCFGGAALIVPLTSALQPSFWNVLTIDVVLLVLLACMYAVLAALMAEQFPTEVRSIGIGAPYNIGTAIFGGTAPYLLTWFAGIDMQWLYFAYVAVLMVISGLLILAGPETSHTDLNEPVEDAA